MTRTLLRWSPDIGTERTFWITDQNHQLEMVRFAGVRDAWERGDLNPLQVEHLADVTDSNNCCSPDEPYASVEEMLATIEAGWLRNVIDLNA